MAEESLHGNELVALIQRTITETLLPWVIHHRHHHHNDELLAQIRALLREQAGTGRCRFSEQQAVNVCEFFVLRGRREDGTAHLREWLTDAESLIIADPYLMKGFGPQGNVDMYVDELNDVIGARPRKIEVFYNQRYCRPEVQARMREQFQARNVTFIEFPTEDIHDRVWAKNESHSRSVGTSFNGIGCKASFIHDLAEDDHRAFCDELARIRAEVSPQQP